MTKAEQGTQKTEPKELTFEERQALEKAQKEFERKRRLELKALKNDNEYFQALMLWYQYQMKLPEVESKYNEMLQSARAQQTKQAEQLEAEGIPDEEEVVLKPEGGLVDLDGNKLE